MTELDKDNWVIRGGLLVLIVCLLALAFIFVALTEDAEGQELDPRTRSTRDCDFDLTRPEVVQVSDTGVLQFRMRYSGRGMCHAELNWEIVVIRETFRVEVRTPNGWQVWSTPSTVTRGCQQPNWCFTEWRTASRPCSYNTVPRIYRVRGRWEFRSQRPGRPWLSDEDVHFQYSPWSPQWPCGLSQ